MINLFYEQIASAINFQSFLISEIIVNIKEINMISLTAAETHMNQIIIKFNNVVYILKISAYTYTFNI